MRKPLSLALLTILALPLTIAFTAACAHADSDFSSAAEWSGIKNILSVMGPGKLTPADKQSILDILDAKSQVEEGQPLSPMTYPATPIPSPALSETTKKQLPHRIRSVF
jgi:hypothetical protein